MNKSVVIAAVAGGLAAIALSMAQDAHATPAQDYYSTLTGAGLVIWDYPLMLRQGAYVCELLYDDVNPYPWLTQVNDYDSRTAATIIMSAKTALCPGNAVTA